MSTSIANFFATQANSFLARLRNKGQPNRSNHEAVTATDLLSELLQRQMSLRENAEAKIEALQVALCRWLPVVSLDNSELSETIASDAMLLAGMKSETPRECWMEIYPTMKADLEREQGVRVDAQRQLRELQAARDAGADLDCDDRRDDADFWWSVAAFRGIELCRQIEQAQAAEGWKEAVANACVIANINYDDNPVASLDRLIGWHENTVLDPQISERAGRAVKVEITEAKLTRSIDQNSRMWALLSDVSRQVEWPVDGKLQKLSPEEWKDIFSAALLRGQRVAQGIEGGFVMLGTHTSKMSVGEMIDLQTLIEAFGVEHNVVWGEKKGKLE